MEKKNMLTDVCLKIGWKTVKLGDFIDFVGGGTPDKKNSDYWNGDIKWASVKDVKNKYLYKTQDSITEFGLKNSSSQLAKVGELILVTRISPGNCVIVKDNIAINQDLKIVRLKADVSTNFIYYFFTVKENEFIKKSSGTTVKGIRLEEIRAIEIDLPPLPEQRAIVSKIEQLFSELDNGIANLKLAQEQLKVYRQAVLKKAFEGKLTEEWREKNSKIESADKLLSLISEMRKTQWEDDQLDKFQRAEKKPKDSQWKLKYKEPCFPDTAKIPNLPKSWSWVSPEQIASWDDSYALAIGPFGSNLKVSDYTSEGVPLIFVRNIRSGVFDNENTKYVSKTKAEELRPHWVNSFDILITKMGEPPGDACLYPNGRPLAIITADCIKFRLCSLLDNPIYFVYAINSNIVRSQINSLTIGVAQKKISLERFKSIALPLPPVEEQKALVQEIETRLSVCDKIEQDIEANLERAEALRQSILKKAFEGKLLNEKELAEVRKAEDWEPAEVLLKRIRAERMRK